MRATRSFGLRLGLSQTNRHQLDAFARSGAPTDVVRPPLHYWPRADAPEEEEVVVVESPLKEGIAMIRAPLSGASRSARTAEALKSANCAPFSR